MATLVRRGCSTFISSQWLQKSRTYQIGQAAQSPTRSFILPIIQGSETERQTLSPSSMTLPQRCSAFSNYKMCIHVFWRFPVLTSVDFEPFFFFFFSPIRDIGPIHFFIFSHAGMSLFFLGGLFTMSKFLSRGFVSFGVFLRGEMFCSKAQNTFENKMVLAVQDCGLRATQSNQDGVLALTRHINQRKGQG